MINKKPFCLAIILLLWLSGCHIGSAEFTGTINGHAFDPSGTVFAYVDQSDTTLQAKPLLILMTWVSIDPSRSLDHLGDERKSAVVDEFTKRDAFALIFDDEKKVFAGKHYQVNNVLSSWVHLDERNSQTTNADLASIRKTVKVRITNIDRTSANPVVEGNVEFYAGTSKVSASFSAPLIQKNETPIAKSNWKSLTGQTEFLKQYKTYFK